MRTSVLIVLASLVTMTSFGCDDGTGSGSLTMRRARRGGPPPAGASADHDENDVDDDDGVENPNADDLPSAPSAQGISNDKFSVTVAQNTPVVDLGEQVDLDVTLAGKNGFSGLLDVSVSGLPAGTTASPVQATVSGAAPTTVKLAIKADYTAVVSAPNTSSPLVITARSGGETATANANFRVAPRLKLTIPVNVDALRDAKVAYRDEWGAAFGATPQALRTQEGNGIVVTVFNADSKEHVIHGANGFAHGDTNNKIQPNAFEMSGNAPRTRTLNVGATVNGYLHEGTGGAGASFQIKVEEAN